MKRLLWLLLCSFAVAQGIGGKAGLGGKAGIGGGGAVAANNIVLKQKCPTAGITGGNNAGTTVSCTFTGANTNPSTIIVYGMTSTNSGTLSISDTVNSYSAVGWSVLTYGTTLQWNAWCASNTSTSTLTVTLTGVSNTNLYVGAIELTGATCTVDTQQSQNSLGLISPSFTTTNANDIILGFAAGGSGSSTATVGLIAGTNGTMVGATSNGGASPAWEYRLVTATVSGATAAFATGDSSSIVQMAAYKSQ